MLPDPRAERRRRLAEPDLEFRALCARKGLPATSTLQLERAWDAWQAKRYQRGETGQQPGYTDNPFRPRWPFARTPAPVQETGRRRVCSRLDCYRHPCVAPGGCVDTLAVPMTPFLPAPYMAWDSYSYGKPPTLI